MKNFIIIIGGTYIAVYLSLFSSKTSGRKVASINSKTLQTGKYHITKTVQNSSLKRSNGPKNSNIEENKKKEIELLKILDNYGKGVVAIDEDVLSLARKYIQISDGHVKKAALIILSVGDKSKESFDAIINNILNYHDSMLVDMSLVELTRYKDETYFNKITQDVSNILIKGSIFAKRALAKKVHMIITPESYQLYSDLLKRVDQKSKEGKLLKASIRQYHMSATGG